MTLSQMLEHHRTFGDQTERELQITIATLLACLMSDHDWEVVKEGRDWYVKEQAKG
jgi:hypothetical protein